MVKGLRIPRVFTIHGFIYGDTLVSRQRWPRLRSWIWRRFETSGWADQPHIISISPYVRERLTGIATGVIHDIDNPISESFFHIERKEKKGIIFSAGVISRRKNTLALIEAYAILMGKGIKAELRLAGDVTEPRYGKLVEDCINKYNLKDKVKLLGRLTTQKIAQELESATLFALVSLEENSPMGIEEAMAAGIPVVTSNRCGMPYMVRHGESGFLVNPKDPCDIARRLGQILSEPTLKKSMADRSKAIALERFHPRRVAQRTLEVYYEAIQRKSDNPPEEKRLGGDDRRSP
jgi:glycosyltransferase involved in cell wall biosynthesis